ncbi:MAG: ion transporter [Desulfatibacillaceae bacterium]
MGKGVGKWVPPAHGGWRGRLHEVIFEADTPAGKAFDVGLILCILVSIAVVMADSVDGLNRRYGEVLVVAEWCFTIVFTIEYVLRLLCLARPRVYATSFFGVVDLLAIVPTYLSVLFPGSQHLAVIRSLRLLRVFRVLKLAPYLAEANLLLQALRASRAKIIVFLCTVASAVVILGTLMYVVEGDKNGFDNIPVSVYWAIVTLTTVGYGDISPGTGLGRALSALVMILGYSILVVPTGIVTSELTQAMSRKRIAAVSTQACPACGKEGHDVDARHCKYCGAAL